MHWIDFRLNLYARLLFCFLFSFFFRFVQPIVFCWISVPLISGVFFFVSSLFILCELQPVGRVEYDRFDAQHTSNKKKWNETKRSDSTKCNFFRFRSIWFYLRILFATISINNFNLFIYLLFFDYEIENLICTQMQCERATTFVNEWNAQLKTKWIYANAQCAFIK